MIGWLAVFALVEVEAQGFVYTGKVKEYLATLQVLVRVFRPMDRISPRPRIKPNQKGGKSQRKDS